jgi:hypothetical protein
VSTHHILNLGAGIQSTALALISHRREFGVPKFTCAIFADVGDEPRSVYDHLEWLVREVSPSFPVLIRSKGITLSESLVRGTNSTGQRVASIPAFTSSVPGKPGGIVRRQCTKEFKIEVVEKTIRQEILGLQPRQRWPKDVEVHQYFGLSFDEGRRVLKVRERLISDGKSTPHFPLYDSRLTRTHCVKYLERYGIPHIVPRSACVFCPYKSNKEWRSLRDNDPEGWNRALKIDEAIRSTASVCARGLEEKLYLHRSCLPLNQAPIDEPQSAWTQYEMGFVNECEGMCGL